MNTLDRGGETPEVPASSNEVPTPEYDYDAFATYATDPDRDLVRAIEQFVEGFHRRSGLAGRFRVPLQLCVDGRDFRIPRRGGEVNPNAVADIVENYQRRSRALIVFCGSRSRAHPWIDREVRWWLQNRPGAAIYFALTHGSAAVPADVLPPALLERGGGDLPIFFDLREFYRKRWLRQILLTQLNPQGERRLLIEREVADWTSVRPFDEEAAKLVARLLSDATGGELSLADIEDAWAQSERRAQRRRKAAIAIAGAVVVAATYGLLRERDAVLQSQQDARAEAWLRQARTSLEQGSAELTTALAYSASALFEHPNAQAVGTAIEVMGNLLPVTRILRPDGGEPAWTEQLLEGDRYLVTGGRSSIIRIIDTQTGGVVARLNLEGAGIRAIAVDAAGHRLFVATDRGLFRLQWRDTGGGIALTQTGRWFDGKKIGGIALTGQGRAIVGLLMTSRIYAIAMDDPSGSAGTLLATVMDPRFAEDGPSEVPSGIYSISIRGDRLIVTGIDGVISVYSLQASNAPPRQFAQTASIFAAAVTRDGKKIVVGDQVGGLRIYDLDTFALLQEDTIAPRPASVVRGLDGLLSRQSVERTSDVGVALDPTGTVVAVTSFDKSVRFLTLDGLSPIGAVVHSAAPRDVVFSANGSKAFTVADDGAIQVVDVGAVPEVNRTGGIAGFVVGGGGKIAAWPVPAASKPGFSHGTPDHTTQISLLDSRGGHPLAIGRVADAPWDGRFVNATTLALRLSSTTRLPLLSLGQAGAKCDVLQHPNEVGDVELVGRLFPGADSRSIVTMARRLEPKTYTINAWNVDTGKLIYSRPSQGPPSIAANTVAVMPTLTRMDVYSPANRPARTIDFVGQVTASAVSPSGEVAAAISGHPGVCLCQHDSDPLRGQGETCGTSTAGYVCRTPASSGPSGPLAMSFTPSGNYLSVELQNGGLQIASRASGWNFSDVVGAKSFAGPTAFATDPSESYLAVSMPDTGIEIFDLATMGVIADLPTPSHVSQVAFLDDRTARLVTRDAGVVRVWDWSRNTLLKEICMRWNPEAAIDITVGVPLPLSRAAICDSKRGAEISER